MDEQGRETIHFVVRRIQEDARLHEIIGRLYQSGFATSCPEAYAQVRCAVLLTTLLHKGKDCECCICQWDYTWQITG